MSAETQETNQNPEKNDNPGKNSRMKKLPVFLAGVFLTALVAAGAVFVMNGLLIKAKEITGENGKESAQEVSEEDALTSTNTAIALAEDLLATQEENTGTEADGKESGDMLAAGEQSGKEESLQEEAGEEDGSEETNLLDHFVDRYGTVVPRDMTDSECVEALAELAEQYPEFEEIYENWEDYPMQLLVALYNNPEMIDFASGYLTADTETAGELTEAEVNSDFPYYLQWDSRWGYLSYGVSNIGLSGCGPTCLSMVIVKLTKNAEASPAVVAEYAMEHGYYIKGSGTAWSLMTTGAAHFGITGKALSSSTKEADLLKLLEEGYPVICSVKAGDFTKGGHFIVLAGVEDGKIRVYDPNSVERSSRLWDYETLKKQIKKMWVYEAAE